MEEKILKSTHEGDLHIGNTTIPSAVLEDGTRVLISKGFLTALGRPWKGSYKRTDLPNFLDAKNLIPFISNELRSVLSPVKYRNRIGKITNGYKAELLPMVCDVYLEARESNNLNPLQIPVAKKAEILVRSLSKIGIIALIDEATGYQEIRDKKALQQILDKYLLKEQAKWAKRFPDEFYEQMFRLRGWQWQGMKINRPSVVGKYTNDLVYERLAPGVLTELKRINPPDEKGRRKSTHQQWLTEDVGHPALQRHLNMLVGFERASANWGMFYRMVQRALPKLNEQIPLAIEE